MSLDLRKALFSTQRVGGALSEGGREPSPKLRAEKGGGGGIDSFW
jgi:hypothetical protein